MQLLNDWRTILVRAWSVRLMVVAAILSGAEVALQFYAPNWPDGILATTSGLVTAGALVARILAQSNMED